MFAVQEQADKSFVVRLHNWENAAPREVFAVDGTLVDVAGAFNVFDGFVIRRGLVGIHVAGRQIHVYRPAGHVLDVSGLGHNAFGCFNIVRNCLIRDMTGHGLTSNESRFNTIEDCVIYNPGVGQGDHGIYVSNGAENLLLRRNIWWRTSGGAVHIYSGSGIVLVRERRTVTPGLIESGEFYIVSTNIERVGALRVTIINPLTTPDHLDQLLDALREHGRRLLAEC